ncbi:MAG: ion channel [Candidatus Nanopelagicales bacterium]
MIQTAAGGVTLPRWTVFFALLRSVGVVAVTLLVYAAIPITGQDTARVVAWGSVLGLTLLGVTFVRQMMRVSRAPHPGLAAVEALALVFGMFLAFFAFLYVSLSTGDPGSFTQPIDKVAGVYLSVTILATVGFGDISAVTDLARLVVTSQMVIDLILISTAVKAMDLSARRGAAARRAAHAQAEAAASAAAAAATTGATTTSTSTDRLSGRSASGAPGSGQV